MLWFTCWGVWMTALTLLIGSFVNDDDVEFVEDLNYIDDSYL